MLLNLLFMRDSGISALMIGASGCAEDPLAPSWLRLRVKTGMPRFVLNLNVTLTFNVGWLQPFQFTESIFLQRNIIVAVEVINTHNGALLHIFKESLHKIRSNESRTASNKYAFHNIYNVPYAMINI